MKKILTSTKSIKPLFAIGLFSSLMLGNLSAAITSLTGGIEGGTQMQGQTRYVVDLGFLLPNLPASPNRVLFEAGGDGDGIAITLINSTIYVYQDINAGGDKNFSLDISAMDGTLVSLRLLGDYTGSGSSDTIQLDVFDGSTTLSSGLLNFGATNISSAAGADGYGTGGRGANSIAGSTEGGTPNMNQFNTGYDIGDSGANVLDSSVLKGTLYTGATDSDNAISAGIPDPSTWGIVVVPEPSSTALLGLGGLALMLRRRR